MANVAYALLVRDSAGGGLRTRLDDILEDRIPTPEPPPDMDALRETWGTTPDAVEGKRAFDDMMRGMR